MVRILARFSQQRNYSLEHFFMRCTYYAMLNRARLEP